MNLGMNLILIVGIYYTTEYPKSPHRIKYPTRNIQNRRIESSSPSVAQFHLILGLDNFFLSQIPATVCIYEKLYKTSIHYLHHLY